MTTPQWVGLGLVVPLLGFFIYAYIKGGAITEGQHTILRIIATVFAGFAGGLFLGDALINITGKVSDAVNIVVKGTGGCAFAILIWWRFPPFKIEYKSKEFNFTIPAGTSFKAVVKTIGVVKKIALRLEGFTAGEENVKMVAQEVHGKSFENALLKLRDMAVSTLPEYSVEMDKNDTLLIKKKE